MVVTRRGTCVESPVGTKVSETPIKTAASRSNTPARQRATSSRQTKGEVLSEAISESEHEGAEERDSQSSVSSEVQSSAVKMMTRSRQARSASQPESMNDADVSEVESCCSTVLAVQSLHDQQLTRSRRSSAPSHKKVVGKLQGEEADISEAESCSSSVSAVQATDNRRATRSLRSRAVLKTKPGAKSQSEDTEFSEAESCSTVTSDVQSSQNQRTTRSRSSEDLSLNAEKSQNEDTEVSEAESWCSGLEATVVRRTTRSRQAKGQPASESLQKGVTEVEKCSPPSPSKDPEVAVCREQSTSSPKSTRRTSRRNISQSQQEEVISWSESESVSSVAGSPTKGNRRVESRSEVVSETPSSSRTGSRCNRQVVSQPETIVEAPSDDEEMELVLPAAASPRKEETKPSEEHEEDIQKTADSEGPGLHNSKTVSKNEEQIISEPETTASHGKVEDNDQTMVIELDCESINIEVADGKSKQGKESVSGYKDADPDREDENQNQQCRNLLSLETIKASPKQPKVISLLLISDEGSDCSDSEEEMDASDVNSIQDREPGPSKPRPSENLSAQENGLFVIDTQPGFEPSRKYYLESGTKDSEEEEAESDKEGDQGKESEEEFIDEEEDDDEEAEVLYKRRKPALMEFSSSIDPGLNLKGIGGLYISFDAKKQKSAPSALKKLKEQNNKDVLLEKSVITPDFEKKESVPPYKESLQQLRKKRREERAKTTGDGWYNMKAPEMTTELKNDLKALKMRSAMDPKRFYKKNDREGFPKYLQVGTVVDSPVDFYHARIPKKQRKRTIVEELMADSDFRSYNKKKYKQIMTEKAALAAGKKNRKKNKFSKKK
ncbi:Deoxynucleotidyltransferase terminal-interacting protein 2 [Acipenser ruthenus]|uniref:Deoxynucleotidyltransferase terminal-interacting protein 2 n=1 Tax=Acipenser ruthenus TaxID=7906 RepID=A0A444UEA2_ACIRT|nr:deoxynucleotidyltransferase terminal-interacting protein 2-like [Acipenser ruthenus]RXM33491.1 Deoxynucleotidyltransferase terminal-interacting protein 2 [Acipenser ruthenus]